MNKEKKEGLLSYIGWYLMNILVVLVFKVSPFWHFFLAFMVALLGEEVVWFWVLLAVAVVTPWLALPIANKKPEWFELWSELTHK